MDALIITDVQNDFIRGGSLPVPDGEEVIPVINELHPAFELVVATQDWHPSDHGSFAVNHPGKQPGDIIDLYGIEQELWPQHCVQGSHGADFAPGLDVRRIEAIVRKGTDSRIDSYSTFYDNAHLKYTGLDGYLKSRGVTDIFLAGLAGDYCVYFSALDGVKLGYKVHVISDGTKNIRNSPSEILEIKTSLEKIGVSYVESTELINRLV